MENSANERFRHVLIPAFLCGVGTNIYILLVLIICGAMNAIWSPLLGTIPFAIGLIYLRKGKEYVKPIFLISAFTVCLEIIIHTYFLGWNSGFFYFFIILPAVFVLNSSWRLWMIIVFNVSIIISLSLTFYFFNGQPAANIISIEYSNIIYFINASSTGMIVIFVLLYFNRTVIQKDRELFNSNTELEKRNTEILAQNEYSKVLIQEIHHRVKNNLQIISSLMSLQSRSIENKEANRVLNESRRRVEAIALIHQKLYQDNKGNLVDFKSYLEEILAAQKVLTPGIECQLLSEKITISLDTAVPLGLVVSEIITNSVKHAFNDVEKPLLIIELTKENNDYQLRIKDNGIGLPEGFNIESSDSLGSEIIVALVSQINATIDCKNNSGLEYKINFQDNQ